MRWLVLTRVFAFALSLVSLVHRVSNKTAFNYTFFPDRPVNDDEKLSLILDPLFPPFHLIEEQTFIQLCFSYLGFTFDRLRRLRKENFFLFLFSWPRFPFSSHNKGGKVFPAFIVRKASSRTYDVLIFNFYFLSFLFPLETGSVTLQKYNTRDPSSNPYMREAWNNHDWIAKLFLLPENHYK